MNQRFHFFFIISFAFLVSCTEENLFETKSDGELLKEMQIGGEVYQKYSYNKYGLIEEEKSKFHYSRYIYGSSNKLIKSEHYWDERIVSSSSYVLEEAENRTDWVSPENTELDVYTSFEYDRSGKLKETVTYRIQSNTVSTSNYNCKNSGQIDVRTWKNNIGPDSIEKYYYNADGNLIKKEKFFGNELQTTTEYEFDNQQNPYYSFRKLMTPGKYTNRNNIVKETYTLHFEVDAFIEKVQVTEYEYTYNKNGFPLTVNGITEYIYN